MGVPAVDRLDPGALTTQSIRASVIIADADLRVVHVEGPAFDRHGYQPAGWAGRLLSEVFPVDVLAELEPRYRAALAGEPQSFDYWSKDGRNAYWEQITPVCGADGVVTSVVAVLQDVTDRLGTSGELSRSEARLRESERLVGLGSWERSLETGEITYSPGFARLLGLAPGEPLDVAGFVAMVFSEDRETLFAANARCLKTGSALCELRLVARDGLVRRFEARAEIVRARDGHPECMLGAMLDVTDKHAAEAERLEAVSMFRQGFDTAPIGMVLLDPDSGLYRRVNDAMCALLGRPREELIGASADSVTHPDDRSAGLDRRRALIDGSLASAQSEVRFARPDGSIVWAMFHTAPVYNSDGTMRALFSQVIDITERKEHEARFEQDVNDALWLGRIRDAVDDDRLVLYAQPIVDLLTGETVQQELLLRMRDEDGLIIAPDEFLPIAERYGLISEIDRWVIRQAVELAAKGEATEFNLSGASIGDPGVMRELASALEHSGADPSLLIVEVTETAMMNQLDAGRRFAEQVTALGCQLALDDFGTGYASLSYLKQIPAQHLKIDVEFVRDVTRSLTDERLVRGIIGIAREFNQTTIAEGVEDEATLVRLRELGANLGQGYLFGRPQPLSSAAPIATVAPAPPNPQTADHDPVAIVRRAFAAFAGRDLDTLLRVSHPDIVLRPHLSTAEITGRQTPYRGHDGVRAYARDISQVWMTLELTPTSFRAADQSVIVFGRADSRSATQTNTVDVLWVWKLRDGLIASVEVFQTQTPTFSSEGTKGERTHPRSMPNPAANR